MQTHSAATAIAPEPRIARLEPATVPHFLLYGDERPSQPPSQSQTRPAWFVNVERIADRCRAKGWQIKPHAHPDFGQLLYVRSGRGTITLEDRTVRFDSPFMLLLPSHCVHGFDYETDTDGWVITIEAAWLRQINARLNEFSMLWTQPRSVSLDRDSDEAMELHGTLRRLEREIESQGTGHVVAAEALLTSLFLMLVRRSGSDDATWTGATQNGLRLIDRFRDLIDRHYRQDWQIQDYASALGVSLAQLRATCVAATGQHPIKMIHACIITEAKRHLLFGQMTVEQIAYALGFSDPAYFTRFFKKEVTKTPSQFRADGFASALQPVLAPLRKSS